MLTPTGVTSSAYWDAIKAGNATHVRITFTGQNIVLDDSDIDITKGLEITDIFNGDTDLVFGKAVAKQVHFGILNSSKLDGLIWSGEFTLEMGVEIGNPLATNWVQIGVFSGKKPNNVTSVNVIDFTAYDRMTWFDVLADNFYNSLTYPKTVQQIYNELCSYVGLTNVSGNELPNIMSRSYAEAPVDMSGYTCREILAWIAEASGCYARMTADGQVKLSWFTDNTAHAVTGNEEFSVESGDINDGMTWDEEDQYTWDELDQMTNSDIDGYRSTYRVEQLTVKQLGSDFDIDYPSEFPGANLYMIVENPFLSVSTATEITNYIKPIYDRLDAFGGYLPISIDCVGCWLVEAGDIVTVDANTETIVVPVFVRTLRWNGAINDNYEATGNKERQQYATSQSKERVLENKYIKLITKDLYYGIQSGIEIEPAGITISGGKYIKINSGSSLYIESGGDIDVKSGSTLKVESGGNVSIKSGGAFDVESGGNLNIKSGAALKINSGGGIDVESGGNLNVKSGGSFDIRTGGTFSLQSGNFDIDSSGNVSFKGGAEILSGKYLKIKSGGNLDVESGSSMSVKTGGTFSLQSGNFSVDSSGNVALKGGVEITSGKDLTVKSGGNFTVDAGGSAIFNSNRFYVDSTNLYISSYSGNLAIYGTYPLYNIKTGYAIGNRATKSCDFEVFSDPNQIFVGSGSEQTAYYNLRNGIVDKATNSRYDEEMEYTYGVIKEIDKDTETNTLMYRFYINGRTWDRTAEEYIVRPSLLDVYCVHYHNYIWGPRAYISNIYYGHMYQNSSRDIKHDIEPLEPVGNKLDLLRPVTFVYDDDESEQTRMGLIYEDSIEIMPEICTQDEGKKAINYVELIPALLKEIQDLRKRVSELEERG